MIVINLSGDFHDKCEIASIEIEKFANNNLPEIEADNDGIGFYEYGSQNCFDAGTDYATIESNGPYVFGFDLSDMTEDEREDFLNGFVDEYSASISGTVAMGKKEIKYHAIFQTDRGEKVGDLYTITGDWIDD